MKPRDLPSGSGFTVPHVECFKAAQLFLEQLRAGERALPSQPPHPALHELHRHARGLHSLSQAVQIFAGMAAEAALNLYGVLALGEDRFYAELDRKPFPTKLKHIMQLAREAPVAPDQELIAVGSRITAARNAFVHPKPRELDDVPQAPMASAPSDLDAAEQAVKDVERFVFLLRTRDRDYYPYFGLR